MANRQIYPKVLFFIMGSVPTAEQMREANDYGPGVAFRNAAMVGDDQPLEDCDAVCGEVPLRYADALPSIDDREAIEERMRRRDPNNQEMLRSEPTAKAYDDMTDEEKAAANATLLRRGEKRPPVNVRLGEPVMVEHRLSQAGTPRVVMPNDGWGAPPPAQKPAGEPENPSNDPSADQATREAAARARAGGVIGKAKK